MKQLIFLMVVAGLLSCHHQPDKAQILLQNRIDSLEIKLADTYRPGFGEFMGNIQAHHAKLWFAGQNHNWKLADFEIHEIMEGIEGIKTYETDRKETESIRMIEPALDSVEQAIKQENIEQFNQSYSYLTNTCVNCHQDNQYEFIQIKIPEQQYFSNQEFAVKE